MEKDFRKRLSLREFAFRPDRLHCCNYGNYEWKNFNKITQRRGLVLFSLKYSLRNKQTETSHILALLFI